MIIIGWIFVIKNLIFIARHIDIMYLPKLSSFFISGSRTEKQIKRVKNAWRIIVKHSELFLPPFIIVIRNVFFIACHCTKDVRRWRECWTFLSSFYFNYDLDSYFSQGQMVLTTLVSQAQKKFLLFNFFSPISFHLVSSRRRTLCYCC